MVSSTVGDNIVKTLIASDVLRECRFESKIMR